MIQKLLRIQLPEGALLYPSRFRELLAREPGMPPILFSRAENGVSRQGAPSVRFVGGRRWVGILFDGALEPLLYEVMGPAVRAAQVATGRVVPVQVESHELTAEATQFPVEYWVRELVIKTRTDRCKAALQDRCENGAYAPPPQEAAARMIQERLVSGLIRHANASGVDLPSTEQLELTVLEVEKNIPLQLQTTYGVTREYVRLVNAKFSAFAQLRGMWFAGNLTSRGYGRIGFDLSQLAVNIRREESHPRKVLQ